MQKLIITETFFSADHLACGTHARRIYQHASVELAEFKKLPNENKQSVIEYKHNKQNTITKQHSSTATKSFHIMTLE